MPRPSDPTADHEAKLADLVEDVAQRLERGETVDLSDYVATHPDQISDLEQLLPSLEALALIGGDEGEQTDAASGLANEVPDQLGDFRIVREIGRGGMGVVYEAEQVSLERRVALKVLPLAGVLDRRQIRRFKIEARAAAALDHPHVVPVYAVGSCRAVHYYAMQYVDGETLADVIEQLRSHEAAQGSSHSAQSRDVAPDANAAGAKRQFAADALEAASGKGFFYGAATLIAQMADALHHAHEQGVIHRDVKPGNALVNRRGNLMVADFGLARLESEAGATMSGDLLGTIRYMSPEQALGNADVDRRTDVYSLGATLYELLTLRPVFSGANRQEIFRQIAFDEPQRPTQVRADVPRDLEVIALKALQKDAVDRYANAGEMLQDLRRYLTDQPILAKPPTIPDILARWTRRHHRAVGSAAVAMLFLVVGLTIAALLINDARKKESAAREKTDFVASGLADELYAANMRIAYELWEKAWSDDVREVLQRQMPSFGESDRRDFGWHLLNTLAQKPRGWIVGRRPSSINEAAVFPDGNRIASVEEDGVLCIWDAQQRKLLKSIELADEGLHAVAISPDGSRVAAASKQLFLCTLGQGDPVAQIASSEATIESLAFTADGKAILYGARYQGVGLVGLDGTHLQTVGSKARLYSIDAWRERGEIVTLNRRSDRRQTGVVELWTDDLRDRKGTLDASSSVVSDANLTVARFSPCGRFVAAGEFYKGRIHLFGLKDFSLVASLPPQRAPLLDLAYSPGGDAVATGSEDGTVRTWSIQTTDQGSRRLAAAPISIRAHAGRVHCVRFLNGNRLLSCGQDGELKCWNLPPRGNPRSVGPVDSAVRRLEFSSQWRFAADGVRKVGCSF